MTFSDFETEDIVLLTSLAVSTISVVVDEIYESTIFKVIKIAALIVSIVFAVYRIKMSKPFFKDISEKDWIKIGNDFQVVVSKKEHQRGKFPHSRCLVPNGHGGYGECFADGDVQPDGNIIIRVSQPAFIRLEVRK